MQTQLKKTAALAILLGCALVVTVPGVAMLLDEGREAESQWVRVTTLDKIPTDVQPELFMVWKRGRNAWEQEPSNMVGAVFLQRPSASEEVLALSAFSPWLGSSITYDPDRKQYYCICHSKENYDLAGRRLADNPAPRDLDRIEVRIDGNDVWVKWEWFRSGISEKIPE